MTNRGIDLTGKRGLVVGIANADSIAYGCARALRDAGAELAITYLNAKARPHVARLADTLEAAVLRPLDVEAPGQMADLFAGIADKWGRLDFVVHSIAFAPAADLHGRVVDCSLAGFQRAMHVSCYSLMELSRFAEPLLVNGGTILAMTFYGGEKVVENYNLMGPVKAALDATVRSLAHELGAKRIRVHALSPGPLRTRAASGLERFDRLLGDALARTPQGELATIDDVGQTAAFLVSDAARRLTGNTVYIDGGRHIMA